MIEVIFDGSTKVRSREGKLKIPDSTIRRMLTVRAVGQKGQEDSRRFVGRAGQSVLRDPAQVSMDWHPQVWMRREAWLEKEEHIYEPS